MAGKNRGGARNSAKFRSVNSGVMGTLDKIREGLGAPGRKLGGALIGGRYLGRKNPGPRRVKPRPRPGK